MDKSPLSGEYYYHFYWAHALIRHYLTTGRKYALIKKYAHNKYVHLLTRLYGTTIDLDYDLTMPIDRCMNLRGPILNVPESAYQVRHGLYPH